MTSLTAYLLLIVLYASNVHGDLTWDTDFRNLKVNENQEKDFYILTLKALNEGTSDGIIYGFNSRVDGSVTVTSSNSFFNVNRTTGVVTTTEVQLDYESVDQGSAFSIECNFVALLEDNTNVLIKKVAQIAVQNVNDVTPEFLNDSLTVSVDENTVPDMVKPALTNIIVTDFEGLIPAPGKSFIEVSMGLCRINTVSRNCSKNFELRQTGFKSNIRWTGDFYIISPLDFEDARSIQVPLHATDSELVQTTDIVVTVRDVQDLPPVPIFVDSSVEVPDGTLPGQMQINAQAQDQDTGNRPIYYTFSDAQTDGANKKEIFSINSETGYVTNLIELDLENETYFRSYDEENPHVYQDWRLSIKACEIISQTPMEVGVGPENCAEYAVKIFIFDVNDNRPLPDRQVYEYFIKEDIGNTRILGDPSIIIFDRDTSLYNKFTYKLLEQSDEFRILPDDAILSIKNTSLIDFENGPRTYELTLIITDVEDDTLTSQAKLIIKLQDTNDNSPVFLFSAYNVSIREDAQPGTELITISASDIDSENFGTKGIRYTLSDFFSELFQMNEVTGRITVAPCETIGVDPCLDYDKIPIKYSFTVTATDDKGNGRSTAVNLLVNILPANDNKPTLADASRVIWEGTTKLDPDLYARDYAKDSDRNPPEELSYFIISQSPTEIWDINPSDGRLFVNKKDGSGVKFTEGNIDGKFILDIGVTDGTYTGSGTFTITVIDINDNAPKCIPSNYLGTILETDKGESGEVLLTVKAEDADDPTSENGILQFNLQNDWEKFNIDKITGEVTVVKGAEFDFDIVPEYKMIAVVNDQGTPRLACNASITIQVIDQNNKNPTVTPLMKTIEVDDSAPIGYKVGTVKATDPDAGAILRFEFTDEKTAFSSEGFSVDPNEYEFRDSFIMNATTGEIFVNRKLDSIKTGFMIFDLKVFDISSPPQFGPGKIWFKILPFNTQSPKFDPFDSPIIIKEEQPIGSVITSLIARDNNGILEYKIKKQGHNLFAISPSTGSVSTFTRLNYDDARKLNDSFFIVEVTDTGVPALTATASVSVIFENINDIWPVFTKENGQQTYVYQAELYENSPDGTEVVQVFAFDGDRPDFNGFNEIRFYMEDKYFDVHPITGQIFVSLDDGATLDREENALILTTVIAKDNPSANPNDPHARQNQRVATVSIKLKDVNDNAPQIGKKTYTITIFETIGVTTEILQIFSSDKDEGINAQVFYYKIPNSGDPDGFFAVKKESGHVFVDKSLVGSVGSYKFEVEVIDELGQGFSDTATVFVIVKPSANSVPRWIRPPVENMTLEVLEEQYNGMLVYDVHAKDTDTGLNGVVDYAFIYEGVTTQATPEFKINSVTGVIQAKIKFDREKVDKYVLLIKATDRGETPLATTRFLTVEVKDVNDNPPRFSADQFEYRVEEDEEKGTAIGTVQAQDIDLNPVIYYRIISGNEESKFSVGEMTGMITLIDTLDREKTSVYYLDVQASNNEQDDSVNRNRRRRAIDPSITTVKILVGDINDQAPVFEQESYYGCVSSRAPFEKHILTVSAVDNDAVGTGIVRYQLMGGEKVIERDAMGEEKEKKLFAIHSKFGVVTNQVLMQKYTGRTFEVIVNARDAEDANDAESTNITVKIFVTQPGKEVELLIGQNTGAVRLYQSQLLRTIEQSSALDYMCVLEVQDHVIDSSGTVSTLWSDVFVSGVRRDGQGGFVVLSGIETRNIINMEMNNRQNDFDLLYIRDVKVASSSEELELDDQSVLIILIIIAVLIFLVIIFCIVAFMCIRAAKRQKKQLLIHKTHATPVPMVLTQPEPEPVIYDNRAYVVEQEQPPEVVEQKIIENDPVHVQYAVVQRRGYEEPVEIQDPVDDQEVIVVELQDDEPQRTTIYEADTDYRIETEVVTEKL